MQTMSLAFLHEIGISETEAKLYELLLKLGEVPITTLIRESKMKRPTVYKAVHSLTSKGLVKQQDIRKKLHVRPESPSKLQELAETKYKKIEQTKASLTALLPGLSLTYAHTSEKPVVRIYEGLEGLKEIYNGLLTDAKPISALVQPSTVDPELYNWLTTQFVRKRVKAKIHVKAIVASSTKSRDYVEKSPQEFRIARQVDASKFPFQHEIDIYGDKVAIIHYKKDEPLVGIVIHNQNVATTMQAWFDLAWESAT
jgi:HTH-type transcriptional regulator, sugar sensing transcriptional regulator